MADNYNTKSIFLGYRPGANSCITVLIPISMAMGCKIRPLLQELTPPRRDQSINPRICKARDLQLYGLLQDLAIFV